MVSAFRKVRSLPEMDEPLLFQALHPWRIYEALARHTDPPVPLPPREELLALETEYLNRPLSHLAEALRGWALSRWLGDPPLPMGRFLEGGGVELRVEAFRPYPFALAFRGETPLYFDLRGRTARHHLRVNRKGVLFGRMKGVPVPFLSRADELYAPLVLPFFGLDLPGGFLGEALRRGVGLDWGREVLRQGSLYLHPDPRALALVLWDADEGVLEREAFPDPEAFAARIYALVVDGGPLFTSLPKGPFARAVLEGDEEGLQALRAFSDLLAQGYARVLAAFPEALPFLPRFLPDGRWVKALEGGRPQLLVGGKKVVPSGPAEPPPEDPLLAFRFYWDLQALDLSAGGVDLLEVTPEPLALPEEPVAFTPSWVARTG